MYHVSAQGVDERMIKVHYYYYYYYYIGWLCRSYLLSQCRLRSSQVKSIYFNHPSQGNSTNCYLILGLRDKAAPSTSQQINKFPPKRVKNLATASSIFIFVFLYSQESSALSQSEAMIVQ